MQFIYVLLDVLNTHSLPTRCIHYYLIIKPEIMPKLENVEKYDNQVIKERSFRHFLTECYWMKRLSNRIASYMDSSNQRLIYEIYYRISFK